MLPYSQKAIDRFWSYIEISGDDDCWEWKRGMNGSYGCFNPGKGLKVQLSHRFAKFIEIGEILPSEVCVCHKRDNPPCCNPNHLFIGSKMDNYWDMRGKGRMGNFKGGRNGNAGLEDEEILEIRKLYATGFYSQQILASVFHTPQTNISKIVRCEAWTHI